MKKYILFLVLSGCITKNDINSATWLNNSPLPADICEKEPALKNYGFYRRLDTGKLEFIPFCSPEAANYIAMYKDDMDLLLNGLVPKPSPHP